MSDLPSQFENFSQIFIHKCISKFGWSSLSKDTVIDVGCGEDGVSGKEVKQYFPDVQVIFMDKKLAVIEKLKSKCNIECCFEVADIERRDSIQRFEGKMNKVVSTRVFHQLKNKEEAFRNVYRMLKPGGEAAILFVIKSLIHEWLTELLKIPKWKALYKGHHNKDLYKYKNVTVYFREMVENIGFRVLECSDKRQVIPYETDEACKEAVYKMCGDSFKITPELLQEFKDESFQVLEQLNARDALGRMCYKGTDLSLLLVKPA